MKFSGLNALHAEVQQLHFRRRSGLEPLLKQGLEHLERAELSGFRNRSDLSLATEAFLKALVSNRKDIRPYLFLAYVFMLLNHCLKAQKYLNAARSLDSENAMLITFQGKLEEMQSNESRLRPHAVQLDSYESMEQLYSETQLEIITQVKALTELWMPSLDFDPNDFEIYEAMVQQYLENYETILSHLKILDAEMDTYSLRLHLRPLETLIRRHRSRLSTLLEFKQMLADLQLFYQQVKRSLQHLMQAGASGQIAPFESELEQILDRFDLFADKIDAYENQGHNTHQLEKLYHNVLPYIEDYQEALDRL